jgi:two-component system chemotaxis response regulator CheB
VTAAAPVRVLVVDDSATVRAVLRRLVARPGSLEVAGEAADGAQAVEATLRLHPDIVLMDIEMPGTDGFAATERIMALRPTPIVVLSSRAARDRARTAFEAIRCGAVEVIAKPSDAAGWEALAALLPATLAAIAAGRPRPDPAAAGRHAGPAAARELPAPAAAIRFVAIGASTGGPTAVRDVLAAFPAGTHAAAIVVQHIAAGFETSFAEWLAAELHRVVRLAADGAAPPAGGVAVAPPGAHLLLGADGLLRLDRVSPPRRGHRPSADDLFRSCAAAFPRATAGVLLSGMGSDGAEGLAELRRAGGLTVVQDEATSVVFGMPKAALDGGAADIALPPARIGAALAPFLEGGRP